ncbi:hypothetical protein AMECASPLE_023569, partial [Ameca splendens]
SKLCSREFLAETLSLRRRVEQFSITVVTAVTCSLAGRQNELPPPQLRRLAAVNPLFTVEAFFNFVAPDNFSSALFTCHLAFAH